MPKGKINKTLVKEHRRRKTNPQIVETILSASKQAKWLPIAKKIGGAARKYSSVNLKEIDKNTSTGDTVIIIGKVLSSGELNKKVRICALGISVSAKEKLKKTKSEYVSILDEIKANPKAEGIKIVP